MIATEKNILIMFSQEIDFTIAFFFFNFANFRRQLVKKKQKFAELKTALVEKFR